jgi:hypothetical protein
MQNLLTVAIEFTALSGFALFAIAFVSGYSCWKAHRSLVPDVLIDGDALAVRMAEISAEVASESTPGPSLAFIKTAISSEPTLTDEDKAVSNQLCEAWATAADEAPDLSGLTIRQLKAIAKEVKLPKYSSNTASVLMERLAGLPDSVLWEAIAALQEVVAA